MPEYSLHVYDTAGTKQAILTDFLSLSYVRQVNKPGAVWFSIRGDHDILLSLEDKWRVEVRRRDEEGTWRQEIMSLFRNETWNYDEEGSIFSAYCQGVKSLLGWRCVNWVAGTANRSAFTSEAAETIMKTLVDYNLGPNATAVNGRKRDGTITEIGIETDLGRGNIIDSWYCHGDYVLDTLADLAEIAGGDFDLVVNSPTSFSLEFYPDQLGLDLSSTVLFSIQRGNMAKPSWRVSRAEEKTVAAVWGRGEEAERDYVTVTGTNYSSTNDIEVYVDAKRVDKGDSAGLTNKGEARLSRLERQETFGFEVLQSQASRYAIDYDLGDLVSAKNPFTGVVSVYQVEAVQIKLDEMGKETVEVDLGVQ